MCTLTWLLHPDGYEVFFNRDEQRSRPRATPPAAHAATGALYPIDPAGGGTWVALTRDGGSFCLLNHYQARAQHPHPRSRGALIPALAEQSFSSLRQALAALRPQDFAPFHCCYFPPGLRQGHGGPELVTWDGEVLRDAPARAPLISSGVAIERVRRARRAHFQRCPGTTEGHLAFHRSHYPEAGEASVCMHRPDARTHSLSHIQVRDGQQRFDYYDGPPCRAQPVRCTPS